MVRKTCSSSYPAQNNVDQARTRPMERNFIWGGRTLRMLIDTGSSVSVIPKNVFRKNHVRTEEQRESKPGCFYGRTIRRKGDVAERPESLATRVAALLLALPAPSLRYILLAYKHTYARRPSRHSLAACAKQQQQPPPSRASSQTRSSSQGESNIVAMSRAGLLLICVVACSAHEVTTTDHSFQNPNAAVEAEKSHWYNEAAKGIGERLQRQANMRRARNVVLFLGRRHGHPDGDRCAHLQGPAAAQAEWRGAAALVGQVPARVPLQDVRPGRADVGLGEHGHRLPVRRQGERRNARGGLSHQGSCALPADGSGKV
ncbi:hypothetical protein MTO96_036958 [Rhipicephalus appendiculatus]